MDHHHYGSSSGSVPSMDEDDIRERVESLVGNKNARILDCEKKSSLVTEEVLLLNGEPVRLTGEAGERIKEALKAGLPPPPEVLAQILQRAGIDAAPVEVETTMSVKSNTKTSEVSTLKDSKGFMLDEKLKEFEEEDEFESTNVELWEKDPEHLRQHFEKERSKMMDYFKHIQPLFKSKGKNEPSTSKENEPSNPRETSFTTSSDYYKKSRVSSQESSHLPKESHHKTSEPPQSKDSHPSTTPSSKYSFSSNRSPYSPYDRYHHNPYDTTTTPSNTTRSEASPTSYEPRVKVQEGSYHHPGRMPHLSTPSNPKLRPPVPPKPQQYGVLRREKNFQLPVRVVYETFI